MNRRDFLKVTGTAAAMSTYHEASAKAAADRPNLLVIHTDEQNFRTLGCYRKLMPKDRAEMWGPTVCETPNIDWLADNGAIATRFYATTPVCSPSRGAFVTGRYPQNNGVATNGGTLLDDTITFGEALRKVGYATGYAGKWHIDNKGSMNLWAPEREFGFTDNRYMLKRGHWKQLEDTPQGPRVIDYEKISVEGATPENFTTDFLADKTVDFINEHKDEPFCYMLSIPDPHGPNSVRAPYDTMYNDKSFTAPATMSKSTEDQPWWGQPHEVLKYGFNRDKDSMAQYFGMVKCIDDNVGKILDAVRKAGLMEKTIILFTSDHGDMCYEHARINKSIPFEASAKVPFVLYSAGQIESGLVVNEALGCVDFMPTVLDLMGVKSPGTEEGRSAAALFTRTRPADWNDIAIFRSSGTGAGWLAAATKRHKLVFTSDSSPWLFDMEQDPHELKNFLDDPASRGIIRSLSSQLLDYCSVHKDPRIKISRIKSDLSWGAEGTGLYTSDEADNNQPKGRVRRTKNKKKNEVL
ncbi:MAG: sulfatase-like hydrolase/transferase [Opitutaceae bacterium]|nr:sulfatase-like hydrolase/transferase [Opitutaceae bacterium]